MLIMPGFLSRDHYIYVSAGDSLCRDGFCIWVCVCRHVDRGGPASPHPLPQPQDTRCDRSISMARRDSNVKVYDNMKYHDLAYFLSSRRRSTMMTIGECNYCCQVRCSRCMTLRRRPAPRRCTTIQTSRCGVSTSINQSLTIWIFRARDAENSTSTTPNSPNMLRLYVLGLC